MTITNPTVLVMPVHVAPFRAEHRVVEEPCCRLPEGQGQRNVVAQSGLRRDLLQHARIAGPR